MIRTWLTFVALILAVSGCSRSSKVLTPRETAPAPTAPSTGGQAVASNVHFDNGLRMYGRGQHRQASKMFEQALKHDPSNYKAAYYLGMCRNERGRYADARSAFRLAIELGPDDATKGRIYAGWGYAHEMERDFKRAQERYETALKFDSGNTYAQNGKARMQSKIKGKGKGKKS